MEPIYKQTLTLNDSCVDRYGRMKPSMVLFCAQEVAGKHSELLGAGFDDLAQKGIFWAVIRQKVQITRLPITGETIRLETWPMPTTRVAYPRSTVAYDENGNECFRAISLWVLMDAESRAMILPGKSGVEVSGTLLGSELAADANAKEAVVAMALGDVGKYLIGTLAGMTMLQADGKRIIRLLFPLVAPIRYLTAKFFAFPAIRIPAHTVGAD